MHLTKLFQFNQLLQFHFAKSQSNFCRAPEISQFVRADVVLIALSKAKNEKGSFRGAKVNDGAKTT